MPNWVYNTIHVRGVKTEDIKEFVKKYFTKSNFNFDKVIPQPTRKKDCPEKFYRKDEDCIEIEKNRPWFNWYDWRYANWGTKWNACDTCFDYQKGMTEIFIDFSTAWNPPTPIFDALKRQNPHLKFEFDFEYE